MRPAIELFGSEYCPPCGKAKDLITATSPADKGVTFKYIDVGEDSGYAMKQLPVIFVGDQVLEGPSSDQLKAALEKLYASVKARADSGGAKTEGKAQRPSAPWGVLTIFACLGFLAVRTLNID